MTAVPILPVEIAEVHRMHCLRCQAGRQVVVLQLEWTENGRGLARGSCPACGAGVTMLVSSSRMPVSVPRPEKVTVRRVGKPNGSTPWNLSGPITDTHRTCSLCGGWLPLADFPANSKRRGGVASACKECAVRVRAERNDAAWTQAAKKLGEVCIDCGEDRLIALHPEPKTSWARQWRGAGKERKTATVARIICGLQAREARKHFELLCANCAMVRRHPGRVCPR